MAADKDPELEALPAPRRPWRIPTLISLAVLTVSAGTLAVLLIPQAEYALVSGQPTEIGTLKSLKPREQQANRWVHATGTLSSAAVGYRRPMDADRFRLAPVEGNPKLWVELREPEGTRGEYFIPPSSFVGRLVPLSAAGLRHSELRSALQNSHQKVPPSDAWLLIDGAAPRTSRWSLGVIALLVTFMAFGIWGMLTLLKPARPHPAH